MTSLIGSEWLLLAELLPSLHATKQNADPRAGVRLFTKLLLLFENSWLRGQDLNLRPLGYEPNELPGCSTPRLSR